MTKPFHQEIESFMRGLVRRNPGEHEFHQAVREVVENLMPLVQENEKYRQAEILERMTEPDRIVIFRVTWEDDHGRFRANRAWRVQFNNSIGPYKGGMRFHPSVTQSVLKFLGFEQTFKNALTGLPMGGAKGGSNFNPKGKSDHEVMRFCQSLMSELHRHVGDKTDVPAGDIGVGAREIGYMFGQYKRLSNQVTGVLTGKGLAFGGSQARTEATGYGTVYFMQNMLATRGDSLKGKRVVVSGSGNVALHCVEKLIECGATVLTASDSGGFIHMPDGIQPEHLEWLKDLKETRRGRVAEFAEAFSQASFYAEQRPWQVPCDIALPCATQNELDAEDASTLVRQGVTAVAEGANMPTTLDGVKCFQEAGVLFAQGKASNAGGVAVSGLEQTQNAMRQYWSREEVDQQLQTIMSNIHSLCVEHGREPDGSINYVKGANVAGFIRVADAMLAYGAV